MKVSCYVPFCVVTVPFLWGAYFCIGACFVWVTVLWYTPLLMCLECKINMNLKMILNVKSGVHSCKGCAFLYCVWPFFEFKSLAIF